MSYCRWGADSELYVYMSVNGSLCCTGCPLNGYDSYYADNTPEFLTHLKEHREAGHVFPDIEDFIQRNDEVNFGDSKNPSTTIPKRSL